MAKIPFDIKYRSQIESGEYTVVTREDRLVEIKIWDLKGDFPIVGVYYDETNDRETAVQVTAEGKCSISTGDNYCDYFFIVTDKPDMVKFKQELSQMLDFYGADPDTTKEAAIEKWSQKLLSVVHEELVNCGKKYNEGRAVGIELGKIEAMKAMPRWKKVAEVHSWDEDISIYNSAEGPILSANMNGNMYFLDINELKKLSKEE